MIRRTLTGLRWLPIMITVALLLAGCPLAGVNDSRSDTVAELIAFEGPTAAAVASSSNPQFFLFENANYTGSWEKIESASGKMNNLGSWTLRDTYTTRFSATWNDRISSVQVFNGSMIILAENANLGGAWELITDDIGNLSTIGFNDRATSFAWSSPGHLNSGNPAAIVFESPKYRKYFDTLNGGTKLSSLVNRRDANYYPNMPNSISSLRCYNGARITLYSDEYFCGYYLSTSDSIADLAPYNGFDNITESIQVTTDAYPDNNRPLFRYYNEGGTDHFYTPYFSEVGWKTSGWRFSGIECYVFSWQAAGTIPLYELSYQAGCDHALMTEKLPLFRGDDPYYKYTETKGFIFRDQQPGTVALYSFWDLAAVDHAVSTTPNRYPTSKGWVNQGILGYVYPSTSLGYAP